MRETRRPTTRAHAHEALLRLPVEGLRADEAFLALRSSTVTLLDRDRDGLRVSLICVVLLGAACFFIFLQSWSCALLSSAAPGRPPHSIEGLTAAALFGWKSGSGTAQAAQLVMIILVNGEEL